MIFANNKINVSYQKHSLLRHVFAIYGNLPQAAKQVLKAYHSFHTSTSDILFLAVLSANLGISYNCISSRQFINKYQF
jgi:hypothetical protein